MLQPLAENGDREDPGSHSDQRPQREVEKPHVEGTRGNVDDGERRDGHQPHRGHGDQASPAEEPAQAEQAPAGEPLNVLRPSAFPMPNVMTALRKEPRRE